MATRGDLTRQAILEHATRLASRVGLTGLSIGGLAQDLDLSKSGLFAHFQSKEALQAQVLEHAAGRFVETVIRPVLATARGEPRVRAVFEKWRLWPEESGLTGGCFFVAASTELDDRPGPVRDLLVRQQRDWLDTITTIVRTAIAEGHFRKDLDPEQFAYELYAIMLMYHHAFRLLGDRRAHERARKAFESLVAGSRKTRG